MSEPFIGEIRIFSGSFAPRGYSNCDGQLISISQNSALFSLLGTTYGGDGRTSFGLPDLRGRAAIHPDTRKPAGFTPRPRRPDFSFRSLDANLDGQITKEEMEKAFARYDKNKDGKISKADWETPKEKAQEKNERPLVRWGQKGPQLSNKDGKGPGTLGLRYIIAMQGIFPSRS